jgi:hypothetical protein
MEETQLGSVGIISRPLLNESSSPSVNQVPAAAACLLPTPGLFLLRPPPPVPVPQLASSHQILVAHQFISDGIDVNLLWPVISLRPTRVAPPTRHLDLAAAAPKT